MPRPHSPRCKTGVSAHGGSKSSPNRGDFDSVIREGLLDGAADVAAGKRSWHDVTPMPGRTVLSAMVAAADQASRVLLAEYDETRRPADRTAICKLGSRLEVESTAAVRAGLERATSPARNDRRGCETAGPVRLGCGGSSMAPRAASTTSMVCRNRPSRSPWSAMVRPG